MVLVLADVIVYVGLIGSCRVDSIFKVLRKEYFLIGIGSHLIVVAHEVYHVAVAIGSAVMPVVAYVVK